MNWIHTMQTTTKIICVTNWCWSTGLGLWDYHLLLVTLGFMETIYQQQTTVFFVFYPQIGRWCSTKKVLRLEFYMDIRSHHANTIDCFEPLTLCSTTMGIPGEKVGNPSTTEFMPIIQTLCTYYTYIYYSVMDVFVDDEAISLITYWANCFVTLITISQL